MHALLAAGLLACRGNASRRVIGTKLASATVAVNLQKHLDVEGIVALVMSHHLIRLT